MKTPEKSVNKATIGILGPWQTYSHAAAKIYIGSDENLACHPTIDSVFAGIITEDLSCGIVPIWNSTCGLVSDTAISILRRLSPPPGTCPATWWQCPLEVVDQFALSIHHCLAGKGRLEEIKTVTSKIQAIDQCRDWLKQNLPQAELAPCESTTTGLKRANLDPTVAAIASEEAAIQTVTPILKTQIQDNPNNHTEFLVIRRQADIKKRTPKAGDVEYWVAQEKPDAKTTLRSPNDKIHWIDSYVNYGNRFQFVKIESGGGKLTGIPNPNNDLTLRWPLGWAMSNKPSSTSFKP